MRSLFDFATEKFVYYIFLNLHISGLKNNLNFTWDMFFQSIFVSFELLILLILGGREAIEWSEGEVKKIPLKRN